MPGLQLGKDFKFFFDNGVGDLAGVAVIVRTYIDKY